MASPKWPKLKVIITTEDGEVIETSEAPVEPRYVVGEARSVAEAAFRIVLSRDKRGDYA